MDKPKRVYFDTGARIRVLDTVTGDGLGGALVLVVGARKVALTEVDARKVIDGLSTALRRRSQREPDPL